MEDSTPQIRCGGLANLGATCYINTAIQCLNHCPYVWDFLKTYKSPPDSLFHEYQVILNDMSENSVIPRRFIKSIRQFVKGLEVHQQNDIHEFIMLFLDSLNRGISHSITITKDEIYKAGNYKDSELEKLRFRMDWEWYQQHGREYSPLVAMFHGQSITQIICGDCQHVHHTYQSYNELELPINDHTDTLEDCLKQFFQSETLSEWTCDQCNKIAQSEKVNVLWRTPDVLMIAFKRFTGDLRKNEKPIKIPLELSLKKHTVGTNKRTYSLMSAAFHTGDISSGHYFALCKYNNSWAVYDDLNIHRLDENVRPCFEKAYMLFYCVNS